ncbi:hypothetical protein FHS34_001351 [Streptomyces echinatus]|uniref:Uncharacterized protein n=1 Tax=Streptomyces echinatus TaxID=67293 RepID=A0A7W9PRE4_9ACTN|nr:hypothetical protein [Streptomyces echinatus]
MSAEEMEHLMAHTGGIARRSFAALHEDED